MDFFKAHILWISIGVFIIALFGGYFFLFSPPANFPSGSIITIDKGASTSHIAQELYDAHVVARPFILEFALRIGGGSTHVQAGAYLFQKPQNLFAIAYRLTSGVYGMPAVRITFIEGVTLQKIAEQVTDAFPTIPTTMFIAQAHAQDGYLFPDTYSFQPSADAESIIKMMRDNFDAKVAPLLEDISASGHSLSDVVILASLLEKEARTIADKRIVAGILWSRLKLGMPLQVDAARETYKRAGLTSAPICNPGFETLDTALHPTATDYLYYLTGTDGLMHYAKTFAAHQANIRKYLN